MRRRTPSGARAVKRKSGSWRRARDNDAFFREARRRGLRSRAALKLEAIDAREHLFRDARLVVDLGAAPGGWSQVARCALPSGARVVALDILGMEPLPGVEFIRGDFREAEVLERLEANVARRAVDLVMSDMAPNLSGMRVNDQARWRELAEPAAGFALDALRHDGAFLVKLFQGEETESYLRMLRERFSSVVVRKPAASRKRSSETYALARGPKRAGGADGDHASPPHSTLGAENAETGCGMEPNGTERIAAAARQATRQHRSVHRSRRTRRRRAAGIGTDACPPNRPDAKRTHGV